MTIRGKFAVDVQFTDATAADGVSSLKTLALQEATEYTTGVVITVSGTAGASSVAPNVTTYRNASGSTVAVTAVERIAFSWSGSSRRALEDAGGEFLLRSAGGSVSVTDVPGSDVDLVLLAGTGTGTYTIVAYGS